MKKKSILLMLLTLLLGALSSTVALADSGISVTGNNAIDAVITDKDGKVVSHSQELSQWTPYNINYRLTITSGNVENGNTISLTIPDNVQVKQTISNVPVYSSSKEQVGVFEINQGSKTGTVTITNAQAINDTPLNRTMSISFGVYGTKANNTPSSDWIINKVAWTNNQTHNIVWNVAVNNVDGATNKIVIHDMPDSNSELVSDSVSVQYGHYDNNGKFIVEREGTLPITKTNDGFTVNLGNYSEKNAQITYETKPIKQGFVSNKVELVVNDQVKGTNEATIDYTAKGDYDGSSLDSSSTVNVSSSSLNSSSSSKVSSTYSASSSSKVSSSSLVSSSQKPSSSSLSMVDSTKSSVSSFKISSSMLSSKSSLSKVSSHSSSKSDNSSLSSGKSLATISTLSKGSSLDSSKGKSSSISSNQLAKSTSSSSSKKQTVKPVIKHSSIAHSASSLNSSSLGHKSSKSVSLDSSKKMSVKHSSTTNSTVKQSNDHNKYLPNLGVNYDGICKVIITIAIAIVMVVWLV